MKIRWIFYENFLFDLIGNKFIVVWDLVFFIKYVKLIIFKVREVIKYIVWRWKNIKIKVVLLKSKISGER